MATSVLLQVADRTPLASESADNAEATTEVTFPLPLQNNEEVTVSWRGAHHPHNMNMIVQNLTSTLACEPANGMRLPTQDSNQKAEALRCRFPTSVVVSSCWWAMRAVGLRPDIVATVSTNLTMRRNHTNGTSCQTTTLMITVVCSPMETFAKATDLLLMSPRQPTASLRRYFALFDPTATEGAIANMILQGPCSLPADRDATFVSQILFSPLLVIFSGNDNNNNDSNKISDDRIRGATTVIFVHCGLTALVLIAGSYCFAAARLPGHKSTRPVPARDGDR